jgi:hypothetical protein
VNNIDFYFNLSAEMGKPSTERRYRDLLLETLARRVKARFKNKSRHLL